MPEQKPALPTGLRISLIVLFVLVFISLGLNLYLINQLNQARQQANDALTTVGPLVQDALNRADAELAALQESSFTFKIEVDQQLPVEAEIPFNEEIEIPVQVTVPISQTFATTVMVDPFGTGFTVPMDIVVPISMEFPIDQIVSFNVERTIPISTSVPLNLTVPIEIDVSDTDLAPLIGRLREQIKEFETSLEEHLSD